MIIGHNSLEGLVVLNDVHKRNKYESTDKTLDRFIPRTIDLPIEDPKCAEFAQEIREFYFSGRNVSEETKVELTNLAGDYHFNMEIQLLAEAYARHQHK